MNYDYDGSRINLEILIDWYSTRKSDRNEATTRLHLIDELIYKCLGWQREDVTAEDSYNGEYTDYTFHAPRNVLIVEAKKEGNYFDLPAGISKLDHSLSTLIRDYPNLKSAISQAAGYCQSRGVPFGATCNGHQIVVFVANRSDGLPPLEGKALVFDSLDTMLKNFKDLWDSLSKPGIEGKRLIKRLIGEQTTKLPPKLSSHLYNYPGIIRRNLDQTDLFTVTELVFEDVIRAADVETRFLKECYCQSGALSQYALVSKNILEARYSTLFDSETGGPAVVPATSKEGISADMLAASVSRRPILLIGDVGVGKTTFIRHLIKIDAASVFEQAITIYINLGSQATFDTDIKEFIPQEIERQLRDTYKVDTEEGNFIRGVYNLDLVRFSKGIYGSILETNPVLYLEKELEFLEDKIKNKDEHIRCCLDHISKGRKKQIVLFIDNADQRNEVMQESAFLISQELAERWPVTVFVALRPETYHRSNKIGALSGYHAKAFTVAPPRIDKVLEKRLKFADKIACGEIPMQGLPTEIKVVLGRLSTLIQVFE